MLSRRRIIGKTCSLKRDLNGFAFSARLVADEPCVVGRRYNKSLNRSGFSGLFIRQDSDASFVASRPVNSTVMPPRHSLLVNNAMKWVEILPEYIKAFALVVGAGWAYWKFIYQRQREPATDIDIDVRFVGMQKEKWVIEVTCVLENKSLVRHTYRDFQVTV